MAPIKTEDTQPTPSTTISFGEYIFLRLIQFNPHLSSIFGIPGDFNLNLLECLYEDTLANKLKFIGLCNELNAAYTTDGYARVNGLSCLITTFGVGELSAINGIAGAFAEYSKVLHIVGTTSIKQRDRHVIATNTLPKTQAQAFDDTSIYNHHHLVQNKNPLAPPNHDVYKNMIKDISVAAESLDDDIIANITKIDHVLSSIVDCSRPGYLFIPSNIPDLRIDIDWLNKPLPKSTKSDKSINFFIDTIVDKFYKSGNPSVLVDCLVNKFGFQPELNDFIAKLPQQVKLFSSNMSRTVDESLPNFIGCYYGKSSPNPEIIHQLEDKTDLLINLGYFNGETNTGGYTTDLSKCHDYIEIHPDYILIDNNYHTIKTGKGRLFSLGDLLLGITNKLDLSRFNINHDNVVEKLPTKLHYTPAKTDSIYIPQSKLIDWLNGYLQPNDLLIVETCSFQFALPDLVLPPGVEIISQNFYGSIGFAIPATLGATLAVNDLGMSRRILLIEGDGSAQMTIQELSTFLKYQQYCPIMPKVFIINNDGYTVERLIKGPTRPYNDILGSWDWSNLLKTFGDSHELVHKGIKLNNVEEFDNYFNQEEEDDRLQVFDLITGKYDVPERFLSLFCK